MLVQVRGWRRSFQPSMKVRMALPSCLTLSKNPARMAWRVMIPKNTPTRFNHEPLVGVKCNLTRGFLTSQALISSCLWVSVVAVVERCRPRGRQAFAEVGIDSPGDLVSHGFSAVLRL